MHDYVYWVHDSIGSADFATMHFLWAKSNRCSLSPLSGLHFQSRVIYAKDHFGLLSMLNGLDFILASNNRQAQAGQLSKLKASH